MFTIEIIPYKLRFRKPAGTSRGVYHEHKVWYVLFRDSRDASRYGMGECAPLPGLSCDFGDNYAETLARLCRSTEEKQQVDTDLLRNYPSILFGLETAERHYRQRSLQLWNTPFGRGEAGIPINGLIWMGEYDDMKQQAANLLERDFGCIKLKIGAIGFDREVELLQFIRDRYPAEKITLRVDANGAFGFGEARGKLQKLAGLHIHSIEQPIRAGQWAEMARLCASSPLPIALDEELIGIHHPEEKKNLLDTIRPQYIILKPTLHGGISGCNEWIALARERQIGWWITSALESNIGLNSIAQWCATLNNPLPQGLGTGTLYSNNIPFPLKIKNGHLWFNPQGNFPDKHLKEYEQHHC
ncbi:MAG: o-succinylbenzoate synthase [Bacteroidia bacterium]|nr:o-succinylbenzoate synthase [Bacteroidia bacterium]